MKPVVTWIVLANARVVRVLGNFDPGKGLVALDGKCWQAEEVDRPRDKAGVGHSIAGPGVSAVDQSDPQIQCDTRFAREITYRLNQAQSAREFDRLILVSGPHMLGLLRSHFNDRLRPLVVGEIAKDLSTQSMDALEAHIGEVIAV